MPIVAIQTGYIIFWNFYGLENIFIEWLQFYL